MHGSTYRPARDYIDVDADAHTGAYDHERLLQLATEHDPGFDLARFCPASSSWQVLGLRKWGMRGSARPVCRASDLDE